MISSVTPGSFSLTFQIGNTGTTLGGSSGASAVEVKSVGLAAPRRVSRIASWAAIFE
jgi:hypothetical protein